MFKLWKRRKKETKHDLRYADPTHKAFNDKLAQRHKPPPTPVDTGSHKPNPRGNTVLGKSFDRERHPDIAKQLDAQKLTEAERRERSIRKAAFKVARGRGSTMVKRDRPKATLEMKGPGGQAVRRQGYKVELAKEQEEAEPVNVRVKTTTTTRTRFKTAQGQSKTQTSREVRREQFKTSRAEAFAMAQGRGAQTQGRSGGSHDH